MEKILARDLQSINVTDAIKQKFKVECLSL